MNNRLCLSKKNLTITHLNRIVGPYISETGRVAFTAIAVFGLLSAIAEACYPGFVINWISPKSIIQSGVIAGLLALWPVSDRKKRRAGWLDGLFGLIFSLAAFIVAWYYSKPIVDSRFVFSLAVAIAVGLSFFLLVYGDYSNSVSKRQDQDHNQ